MNISYAVQTEDDPFVDRYFKKVATTLESDKVFVFKGTARKIGKDMHVVSIDTFDAFAYYVGPVGLMATGVLAAVVWPGNSVSPYLAGIGGVGVMLISALLSPDFHRFAMMVSLRRLTKRWVNVRPANKAVLRMVANGKI